MEPRRNNWSRMTRVLHWGLALTVTLQLFISLVIRVPKPGVAEQGLAYEFFEAHELIGLTALAFVLLHWIWLFRASDTDFSTLFPWGREGIKQIVQDVKTLSKRQLLPGGPGAGGLVGLIHGLGFLAVTGMVATGGAIFYLINTHQLTSGLARNIIEVHQTIAGLVWVYWVGHGGMALLHILVGHNTLIEMLSLKD